MIDLYPTQKKFMSLSFIVLLSSFVKPALAVDCTAEAVCDMMGGGSCIISSEKVLNRNCELDLSAYAVRITGDGALSTKSEADNETKILCNSLLIEAGSSLTAICDDGSESCGNIVIESSGTVTNNGSIELTGGSTGGFLTIESASDVLLGGENLDLYGQGGSAIGGNLTVLSGGTITVDTNIRAKAHATNARGERGGDIFLQAVGDIDISNGAPSGSAIATSGLIPGEIIIDSGGALTITDPILTETGNGGRIGGRIRLHGSSVEVNAQLRAQRNASSDDIDGGQVWISAQSYVSLTEDIEVEGGPNSRGGTVRIDAYGSIIISGKILAGSTGVGAHASGTSTGGNVQISSGDTIMVTDQVSTDGLLKDGRIDLLSNDSIGLANIGADPILNTSNSTGGQIRIESRASQVSIAGKLAASGYAATDVSDKENGVFVDGCNLFFGTDLNISGLPDGAVHLTSRSTWNLNDSTIVLYASATQGNHLYGPEAALPSFSMSSTPEPTVHVEDLTDCAARNALDADDDGYLDFRLAELGEDCNDWDASVHPDAIENAGDGVDSDCSCTATNTYLPYIDEPVPPACDGEAVEDTGSTPPIDTADPSETHDSGTPPVTEASDTAEWLTSEKGAGVSGCGCSTPPSKANPWWIAPLMFIAMVRRKD
ncbi:MAG: hypothetical protein CL930_14100 [Deltaproteobacteria bacterium]|nr:hypothetical protein [Deltaproteobacteria bacterium]